MALLRQRAEAVPAPSADFVQASLERGMLGVGRGATATCLKPGCVHASMVLGKEVFAVEVIGLARGWTGGAGPAGLGEGERRAGWGDAGLDVAFADVAAIEAELEVLGSDVPFPFVLGDEGALASVRCKTADKGSGHPIIAVISAASSPTAAIASYFRSWSGFSRLAHARFRSWTGFGLLLMWRESGGLDWQWRWPLLLGRPIPV